MWASCSSSSSNKDLPADELLGENCVGNEEGGAADCGRDDTSLGLCGRSGSLSGGANVLIKEAETSESKVDALLEFLTNLREERVNIPASRISLVYHPG